MLQKKKELPLSALLNQVIPEQRHLATQVSRLGIPTVAVSIPLRYMHTGAELISLFDVESVATLVARYIAGELDVTVGQNLI